MGWFDLEVDNLGDIFKEKVKILNFRTLKKSQV